MKKTIMSTLITSGGGHSFCGKAFGQIKTLVLKKKKFSKILGVEENHLIQEPAATNLFKKIGNKHIPFLEKEIFVHGKPKKAAFTLAEVLITLGIIGVVAAITMPVLINKYQEIVTVTKVKKFYSLLSQALQLSFIDHGYPEDWDGSSKGIYEKIIPHLKTLDSCCECCTPKKSCDKIKIQVDSMSYLNGEKWAPIYNNPNYPKLILSDGTAMWFRGALYPGKNNCDNDAGGDYDASYGAGSVCGLFLVDINGFDKAPNQMGRDIFSFFLKRKGLAPHDNAGEGANNLAPTDCYLNSQGWDCSAWILKHGNMKYPDKKEKS